MSTSSKVRKDFGSLSINTNEIKVVNNTLRVNDAPAQIDNLANNVVSTASFFPGRSQFYNFDTNGNTLSPTGIFYNKNENEFNMFVANPLLDIKPTLTLGITDGIASLGSGNSGISIYESSAEISLNTHNYTGALGKIHLNTNQIAYTKMGVYSQSTSITTTVDSIDPNSYGYISTFSASTAAESVDTFTFLNPIITPDSYVSVSIQDYPGTGLPSLRTNNISSGQIDILIQNNHSTVALNDVLKISFNIIDYTPPFFSLPPLGAPPGFETPEWDITLLYSPGDDVSWNGKSWRAYKPAIGDEPKLFSYAWALIVSVIDPPNYNYYSDTIEKYQIYAINDLSGHYFSMMLISSNRITDAKIFFPDNEIQINIINPFGDARSYYFLGNNYALGRNKLYTRGPEYYNRSTNLPINSDPPPGNGWSLV